MKEEIVKTKNLTVVRENNNEIKVYFNNKEIKKEGDVLFITIRESHDISIEEFFLLSFGYKIIDDPTGVMAAGDENPFYGHEVKIMGLTHDGIEISFTISGDRKNLYPSLTGGPINEKYISLAAEVIISNPWFENLTQESLIGLPVRNPVEDCTDRESYITENGPITFTTVLDNVKTLGEMRDRIDKISSEIDNEVIKNLQMVN